MDKEKPEFTKTQEEKIYKGICTDPSYRQLNISY